MSYAMSCAVSSFTKCNVFHRKICKQPTFLFQYKSLLLFKPHNVKNNTVSKAYLILQNIVCEKQYDNNSKLIGTEWMNWILMVVDWNYYIGIWNVHCACACIRMCIVQCTLWQCLPNLFSKYWFWFETSKCN